MTHVGPAPVAARPATSSAAAPPGFVEWGPIFAGALIASALSFVLLTFGTAIGLSATSPWPNSGLSAKALAALAVFWILAQQIGAFLAGGYVAGRMRTRWSDTTQHEVEFRDGLHGGLVWALGIVIGAMLVMATAGSVARTGAGLVGNAASVATVSAANPMDAVLDSLLRPAAPQPQPGPTGAAPQRAPAAAPAAAQSSETTRATIGRILASTIASGSVSGDSRAHLVQLVSQQTGLPPQEVETRVNNAVTAARETADKARRSAILAGLVTAISLVVSFAAAWWAALQGGHHRDNSIAARFNFAPLREFGRPRT
jgi:hypothetical protein